MKTVFLNNGMVKKCDYETLIAINEFLAAQEAARIKWRQVTGVPLIRGNGVKVEFLGAGVVVGFLGGNIYNVSFKSGLHQVARDAILCFNFGIAKMITLDSL